VSCRSTPVVAESGSARAEHPVGDRAALWPRSRSGGSAGALVDDGKSDAEEGGDD
jgi:hypothetical protein